MWPELLKKSIPAFEVYLKESKKFKFVIVFTLVLGISAFWINGLDASLKMALSLTVIVLLLSTYRSCVYYHGIEKISCLPAGCWELFNATSQSEFYVLKESIAQLGSVFFLHFSGKNKAVNLLLASDSITPEEARQLRLTLKVYKDYLLNAKV
jgi:hypothetical protein